MALLGNTVKVEQLRVSRVPFDITKTFSPGDMLKWDSANHRATPVVAGDVASTAVAATLIGIALDSQPIASLNQNLPFGQCNVLAKGMVEFTVDDSATYYPGDLVTIGAGPQLVRKTGASAANVIGVVAPENHFDASAGAPSGIVAVALTTKLWIYLKPQFTNLTSW